MNYASFIEAKQHYGALHGFEPSNIPSWLFPFQSYGAEWAIRKGRGALLFDCGLGKTPIQLTWADNIARAKGGRVLIATPLAVASQTIREAEKFGFDATKSRDGALDGQIVVTNYERLHYFQPSDFVGMVCDESSAIKNFNGKRKAQVTEFIRHIPYRLLCTATAAPNDFTELGTSSEALGELGHMDMLNRFFKNDQNTSDTRLFGRAAISQGGPRSAGWRFKGHAEQQFWKWVCSWARACRKPSDLGFADDGFDLPPLEEREHIVQSKTLPEGFLFEVAASNFQEEREECRRTIRERCEKAAELVAGTQEPSVTWCHLNDEGDLLEEIISGSRQISSAVSDDEREEIYEAFSSGQLKDLVIKDKIGAWGLNWQHCGHVVRFVNHSFEADYQAVRRCWRFGRKGRVLVDRIYTEGQRPIAENLARKAEAASKMFTQLVAQMNDAMKLSKLQYNKKIEVPSWLF